MEETFPIKAELKLEALANKRAAKKNVDPNDELQRVHKEFEELGTLPFSFDSGTTAAVKQMRHKLLMADAGSMNMEIDEIGSNLLSNIDVLTTFLELFDVGKVKQKLIKNTTENKRNEEIDGRTPTNMMLFGTPAKLLNGSKTEEEFYSMLETGYARRCIFGYNREAHKNTNLTPQQLYDMMTDNTSDTYIQELSVKLGNLADMVNFNTTLTMSKDVALLLMEYKLQCDTVAEQYAEHEEIYKAELSHRYFKALKLAGTYAFIDSYHEITEDHLYSAIKLAEDSGEAFKQILTRDRPYVKLAKYMTTVGRELTQADLQEDLPFYKGSEAQRRDLMNLAIAHGYKNNMIIKRSFIDNIEFFKGESLQETNLNEMMFSYSNDITENYEFYKAKFTDLHKLTNSPDLHFVNHKLLDKYRNEENCIPGFNMIVLDVDDGVSLDTAKLLLDKYTYLIYTTKRHTAQAHRFRIILPISHILKLDRNDFKEFMNNIYEFLPFDVDTQTNQRSRKWMTNQGQYWYNQGEVLDALDFIPKTKKAEEHAKVITDYQSLTNLERWFVTNTNTGNRSNQLIKYALHLVDRGMDISTVQNNVMSLNNKLQDKLDEAEILSTIIVSASKAIHRRDIGERN